MCACSGLCLGLELRSALAVAKADTGPVCGGVVVRAVFGGNIKLPWCGRGLPLGLNLLVRFATRFPGSGVEMAVREGR